MTIWNCNLLTLGRFKLFIFLCIYYFKFLQPISQAHPETKAIPIPYRWADFQISLNAYKKGTSKQFLIPNFNSFLGCYMSSIRNKVWPSLIHRHSRQHFRPLQHNKFNMTNFVGKPNVIFVLGGPGSGKGTQCGFVSEKFNFKHISAGDCLREEIRRPSSEDGEIISSLIKEGKIVPAEITIRLLKNKMIDLGWDKVSFLIDGFPRNKQNLDAWTEFMNSQVNVLFCLFLDCNQSELRRRLLGRTQGRSDDNNSVIDKRFETYFDETLPIIKWFESIGKCKRADGNGSKSEVWKDVELIFSQLDTQ